MPHPNPLQKSVVLKLSASLSDGLTDRVDESQLLGSVATGAAGAGMSATALEQLLDARKLMKNRGAQVKPQSLGIPGGYVDQGKLNEILKRVKPGDVLMYQDSTKDGLMARLTRDLFGQARAHHSELFVPDGNGGTKLFIPGNPDMKPGARLRSPLLGVLANMVQSGKFKLTQSSNWHPRNLIGSARKDVDRLFRARRLANKIREGSTRANVGDLVSKMYTNINETPPNPLIIGEMIQKGQQPIIARLGDRPMSSKNVKQMMSGIEDSQRFAFTEPDTWEMGVRRLLLPKRLARFMGGKQPLGCSDGLCQTTGHVADWGKGLHTPQDILNSPNTRVMADMGMEAGAGWAADSAKGLRRTAKIRGIIGAPLAALGAVSAYNSVNAAPVDPETRDSVIAKLRGAAQ